MINNPHINLAFHSIDGNIIRHYTKGECRLDVIFVVEACDHGEKLNWCSYMLNELFEAYEDVYKRATYFIYGYLVIAITMMKCCTHEGRKPTLVSNNESLALAYLSCRASSDTKGKEINEEYFTNWYTKMVSVTENITRVPQSILDGYSHSICF